MRHLLVYGTVLLAASPALAADLPVLRGSDVYVPGEPYYPNWEGAYFGGQAGFASGSANFANGISDLTAYIMRGLILENEAHVSSLTTLPKVGSSGANYGAFIGYNMQWDSAVLGVELNYNHTNFKFTAADSIARSFTTSDGYFNDFTVAGSASIRLTDFASARLKAAWATSWALPYAFIGVAVGRADVDRTSTVHIVSTKAASPTLGLDQTLSDTSNGIFSYGYTVGTGAEVALTQSLFLRAEWEHLWFPRFKSINVNMDTARAALGVRF